MDTLTQLLSALLRGDLQAATAATKAHVQALAAAGAPEQAQAFSAAWDQALETASAPPVYMGRYPHGRGSARVYAANGVRALALMGAAGRVFLRVPHDPEGMGQRFTDYQWNHDDASVRVEDELAALYVRDDGVCVFDHAPQVLGRSRLPAQPGDPPLSAGA